MAQGIPGLVAVNDWQKVTGDRLRQALAVSMEVCGRTGAEACKHAIILMAQSARAMTKQSPKNRPIENDILGRFVRTYKGGKETGRIYDWMFTLEDESKRLPGSWERARNIANRGLAKRSWMWGLRNLGKPAGSRPMTGVADVKTVLGRENCGYLLTNRLSYVTKAMPPGWEIAVQERAGNKIMKQAALKLERKWAGEVRRNTKAVVVTLSNAFLKAVA